MAVDTVLAESVRAGQPPVLRFYAWSPPCLSLGRNQPAAGRYDVDSIRAAGVDVVRRPTGGRAVLHDRELTYSIAVPDRLLGTAKSTYLAVNAALLRGLAGLGVAAELQANSAAPPVPSTDPCFAEPVDGEIVAGGRKLAGSAQLREAGVILQHGSIPLRYSEIAAEFHRAGVLASGSPADVESTVGRVIGFDEVCRALEGAWSETIGPCIPAVLESDELQRVAEREVHFRDPGWTWRR